MSNLKYRKDIDGLRALAVISVVLFHLNISWVKSGFLGVDIFFVISGYLITSIIIHDLEEGVFSIKNFYLRRIRRILPALIVVLIFSSILGWLILLPQDLTNYFESVVSAIASVSNLFFFAKLDFGYFGSASGLIPLLHTWSLGVEEQFYILWPLALMLLFSLGVFSRKKLLIISGILLILSALLYLSGMYNIYILGSQRWYYFPLHRAFELLFGCYLAIMINKEQIDVPSNKLLANILAIVALIMMVIPLFFITVIFPSPWTLVTCFGATLFIFTGRYQYYKPFVHRIFSIKIFIAIGLISYSLYLWHWPIIAYINYLNIAKTSFVCFNIFIISIVLATLSYWFIEKPFRHSIKFSFTKSIIIFWIIPLIISLAVCFLTINNKFGYVQPTINQNKLTYSYKFDNIDNNNCFLMIQSDNFKSSQLPDISKCTIGDTTKINPNILLVGDSHARSDIPMVSVWLRNIKQSAYIVAQKSTPYLYDFKGPIDYVSVTDRNQAITKLIKTKKYKYVIIAGEWANPIYQSTINSIEKSISVVVDSGATPILILDTPILSSNVNNLCPILKRDLSHLFNSHYCQLSEAAINYQQKNILNIITKIKTKYPQLVVIDPKKSLYDNGYYNIQIDNIPIYADDTHLNYIGSAMLGKLYMKEYGNPLKNIIKN